MRYSAHTLLESPAMSAYSERDPPSEAGFSLPPISLKLASSPSNTGSDLSTEEHDGLQRQPVSSYSSRASTFMFSRRSSRLSSNSGSPTKLPCIDRSKSNSVASLNSSRSSKMRRSFREVKSDRNLVGMDRNSLCKSPSCPSLQWDEYDECKTPSSNADLQASMHPSTAKQYGGDDMHLPDIFSSSTKVKQKTKRDSSLPPLVSGILNNDGITPRAENQRERGRKARRSSLSGDYGNQLSARLDYSGDITPRGGGGNGSGVDTNATSIGGGGFLVPITESDKVTAKHKNKKKNKVLPKQQQQNREMKEQNEQSTRNGGSSGGGISGLLHIEGESVQNGQQRLKWEIREEDENIDNASVTSFDETQIIEEIAKENNANTIRTSESKRHGSKTKKPR